MTFPTRLSVSLLLSIPAIAAAQSGQAPAAQAPKPNEVYIPYKNLRETLERHGRGVFLPYDEFMRLWDEAHRTSLPSRTDAPVPALIGRAAYVGAVDEDSAAVAAEVEFTLLTDEWCTLDLRLKDVALRAARFAEAAGRTDAVATPLLRVTPTGQQLVVRGRGRYRLAIEFLKKLEMLPGRTKLSFDPVPAAVSTLEMTVPLGGAEIEIEPVLAAATQPAQDPSRQTRVKAFLPPVERVALSWAARTELAVGMAAVMEVEQRHALSVGRTAIRDDVALTYALRHAPRDVFEIAVPHGWRTLGVDARNVRGWSVKDEAAASRLTVRTYEPQKDAYEIRIELERAMTGDAWDFDLPLLRTEGAVREQGVVSVRQADGLRLLLEQRTGMVQIDPGELPEPLRAGTLFALRFPTAEARLTLSASRIEPRLSARSAQLVALDDQTVQITADFHFVAEEAGLFSTRLVTPAEWQILDVGPPDLVDDYRFEDLLIGRVMTVSLRRQVQGPFRITVLAQRPRAAAGAPEALRPFDVLPDTVRGTYDGVVVVAAREHLEVKVQESSGLTPRPLSELAQTYKLAPSPPPGFVTLMGFEFRDRQRRENWPRLADGQLATVPVVLALDLELSRKKTRITAQTSMRIDLTDAQTRYDAALVYTVQYADVDELRFKVPAALTEDRLTITGADIREKKEIADSADPAWRHWRVTLARPMRGTITLRLAWDELRGTSQPTAWEFAAPVLLAEGPLDHQEGHVVVRKTENFQVDVTAMEQLRPIDVRELKFAEHQQSAHLAFACDRPPYRLSLRAARQEFHQVADLVVDRALIEQVVSRDGDVTTRAAYVLQSRAATNAAFTLPAGARLLTHAWVDGRAVLPQTLAGDARALLVPLGGGVQPTRRSTVEFLYAMKQRGPRLEAPALAASVPIQETRWIVWTPHDVEPLWHDTSYTPLATTLSGALRAGEAYGRAARDWLGALHAPLTPEGRALAFRRLGPTSELRLTLMRRSTCRAIINALWIAAGLAGLRLTWRRRAGTALGLLTAGALLASVQPLPVEQIVRHGAWGIAALAAAWIGQALFVQAPSAWRRRGGGGDGGAGGTPAIASASPTAPEAGHV